MSTFIPHEIGPSFPSEVAAAGLNGLPFSWAPNGVTADSSLAADKLAALQAVVAAHDPKKGAPTAPPIACTKLGLKRAFTEMGVWPKVRDFIAADADRQEDWDLATELKLTDPVMTDAIAAFAAEGIEIDALKLATRANQLVA